jgi:hypothetical protein
VAPIFGAAPLYIKKDKKWQMPLIMRPGIGCERESHFVDNFNILVLDWMYTVIPTVVYNETGIEESSTKLSWMLHFLMSCMISK